MAASYLTREGHERLKKELEYLQKVRRYEIVDQIEEARLQGDLSENAEYDAAKEAQGLNEERIRFLENVLAEVLIIEDQDIPDDMVYIGAKVRLKDLNTGNEVRYVLVGPVEADFEQGRISTTSPVGKALLRHKVGDTVNVEIPAGDMSYEILEISR